MSVPEIVDTPLLDGLTAEERARLSDHAARLTFEAGTDIVRQGEPCRCVYLVSAGSLVVHAAGRGAVAHLGPGEVFGEVTVFTGETASATVSAVTDVVLHAVPHDTVREFLDRSPILARNFLRLLGRRLASSGRKASAGTLALLIGAGDGAPFSLAANLAASVARVLGREIALVDLSRAAAAHCEGAPEFVPLAPGVVQVRAGKLGPDQLGPLVEALALEHPYVLAWAPEAVADRALALVAPAKRVLLAGDRSVFRKGKHPVVTDWAVAPELIVTGMQGPYSLSAREAVERDTGCKVAALLPDLPAVLAKADAPPDWTVRRSEAPFSAALARLARTLAGKRVGIAFGAGAGRGFAHVGALAALSRMGVQVDFIAGTSVGAGVALLHAMDTPAQEIESVMLRFGQLIRKRALSVYSLMSGAALDGAFRDWVPPHLGIEDLPLPTAFVASDLDTGEEVVLRRGCAWESARASASIPGFFPPARLNGRLLVDGGLVSPVPCRVLREMGAEVVLGISLEASPPDLDDVERRMPPWPAALLRAFDLFGGSLTQHCLEYADVPIRTFTPNLAVTDFRGGKEFLEAGERAVCEAEDRLRELLPWLR